MKHQYTKILCTLFYLAQLFSPQLAYAANLPFRYVNNKSVHLRDANLKNPVVIEAGSEISIDTDFLKEHLGTETPTQEQVQILLLNPGEISKDKIVTQSFIEATSKRSRNDFFFPVSIKTKSGVLKSGKMAFQSYNRQGTLDITRTDGEDPLKHQSSTVTAKMKTLIEQNRSVTEAQTCTACNAKSASQTQAIADLSKALQASSASSSNLLFEKYKEFSKEFTSQNRNITKARAGYYKRLFVKSLISKFGEKDAGLILASLTGFAEAPYRDSNQGEIAEISAVLKVVENRANNKFRTKSRTLRDIGASESADSRITNILADWQFSAWNDNDNNLVRILKFNPDGSDNMTKRKMTLAFEAQKMMQNGSVEFLGKMNDSKMQHYHANYVNPNWDKPSNKLSSPIIRVNGIDVDLSKQRGARHIFYSGLA